MTSLNRVDLDNGISMYENFSDNNDTLISLLSDSSVVWNLATPTIDPNLNIKRYRELSKNLYTLKPLGKANESIKLEVSRMFAPAIGCIEDFVVDKTPFHWYNDIEILKYDKGHHMKEHCDNALNKKNKISVFYYVNDDYEGGELVFVQKGITVKPRKNTLLVFNSSAENTHKINPVTSGSKYVVTTFLL
jgi:Rps23 Pro-64 3,4-dihydroxylase Tpa1-like proline 4-hydroxylase